MQPQEAFNKVWNHFVVNKGPASFVEDEHGEVGGCQYRGPGGAKCAAGVLIEDDEYDAYMDMSGGKSASAVLAQIPRLAPLLKVVPPAHEGNPLYSLPMELQGAHDRAVGHFDFHWNVEIRLRGVAEKFSLSIPNE
jgi:hypothetical protein